MSWLSANWLTIAVTILSIDRAIIVLFPNATVLDDILGKLGDMLQSLTGSK